MQWPEALVDHIRLQMKEAPTRSFLGSYFHFLSSKYATYPGAYGESAFSDLSLDKKMLLMGMVVESAGKNQWGEVSLSEILEMGRKSDPAYYKETLKFLQSKLRDASLKAEDISYALMQMKRSLKSTALLKEMAEASFCR